MSPASSGALEIERYIGACLISSQQSRYKTKHHHLQQQQHPHHHHHQYQQQPPSQSQHHHQNLHTGNHNYVPDLYRGFHNHQQQQHAHQQPQQQAGGGDRWAGGLPLIVYAKPQQQHQQQQQQHPGQYLVAGNWPRRMVDVPPTDKQQQSQECNNPLTRLAVHTQGAPLILSNNRYRNKNKGKFNTPCGVSAGCINKQLPGNGVISGNQIKSIKCRENNVDTVSVASDESSGSANSENCLPRIIKPRKRRKKDRKPPPHLSTSSSTLRSLNQDDSFSTDSGATTSPDIINITAPILSLHNMPPSFPTYSSREFTPAGGNEISETPNLHHSFEDIEDHLDVTDINGNVESSCQCRYCDPASQIWDIDRNCYSPFLTSPVESMFRFPIASSSLTASSSLSSTDRYFSSYMDSLTDRQHNHHHQCLVKDISTFSLEDTNRNSGTMDKVSDFSPSNFHQQHRSQSDLEVSTEIVTSLNGHRDLEIKFFTSPTSLRKGCADVVNGDNGDSGEGEFEGESGYLLLDVKCENVLPSHVCDS